MNGKAAAFLTAGVERRNENENQIDGDGITAGGSLLAAPRVVIGVGIDVPVALAPVVVAPPPVAYVPRALARVTCGLVEAGYFELTQAHGGLHKPRFERTSIMAGEWIVSRPPRSRSELASAFLRG
jgi:hypothetical protein